MTSRMASRLTALILFQARLDGRFSSVADMTVHGADAVDQAAEDGVEADAVAPIVLNLPCIQTSRPAIATISRERSSEVPECPMVELVLDGVAVGLAPDLLMALPMMDIEGIEFLHRLHAGRWGYEALLYGALVIWTRGRGPHVDAGRNEPRPDR